MPSCKLSTPEFQLRKQTVIASLKQQMQKKVELSNGYSFRFSGSDQMVDELAEFVKTERICCDFFDFELNIKGDESSSWLTMTGGQGTKEFIKTELEL